MTMADPANLGCVLTDLRERLGTLRGPVTSLKGYPGDGEDEIDMIAEQDVSKTLEELCVIAFCTHVHA